MTALPAIESWPRRTPTPTRTRSRRQEPDRVSLRRPTAVTAPDEARRAPFVALILLIVGVGLVALLVLNTAIAADSFAERSLTQQIEQLTIQEQELQQEVNRAQAPAALARAATEQGMIPAGTPGFLVVKPDGSTQVVGQATPAARQPPPARTP
ncbi:MAG: hypothetical protein ACR2JK_19010 [Geodermatophilaceae bacterium]